MLKYTLPLGFLACCTIASGDILLDQIGSLKGEGVGDATTSSQYFEPKYMEFDIGVLDNFTVDAPINIHTVEVVIDGWLNQWSDPSAMSAISINVYTSPEVASTSLVGDITSNYVDVADVEMSEDWFGNGYLLTIPVSLDVDTGNLWISVIPVNNYVNNGQTGIKDSLIGDEVHAWQANPNGGFGLPDNLIELSGDVAYRLLNLAAPDPCELDLPPVCATDTNADGQVNVNDLLLVIASWLECGDGSYRPIGDVAPMPNGDCCVNVMDVLAVIDAWGSDCTIYGGCCYASGTCQETSQNDCEVGGGEFFGNFTDCDTQQCLAVACCINDTVCLDVTAWACTSMGATVIGSPDCASADCSLMVQGDDCSFPLEAVEGANPFDISVMSASNPPPDSLLCQGTQLNWSDTQQDVWFSFSTIEASNYNFSLCDSNYNTSLVLYEESCENQVACNGDAMQQASCHPYYSATDYELQADVTYLVRIGGSADAIGSGTLIISLNEIGACCLNGVCIGELYEADCILLEGDFFGVGTDCDDEPTPCAIITNDECLNPAQAFLGLNFFDTTSATPSLPEPDDTQCGDTFLDWEESPDIWFIWNAPEDGRVNFTTCDNDSFDTSIVLYANDCQSQIACNGDGDFDIGCQPSHSFIQVAVQAGTDYFIRVGGWHAETGVGILTISYDIGACCLVGEEEMECLDIDSDTCVALGGTFTLGVLCEHYICEEPECFSAAFSQTPHTNADDWIAGTSSFDRSVKPLIDYERAELVNIPSMSSLSVWGFPLTYTVVDGEGTWDTCTAEYLFTIRQYVSDQGLGLPLEPPLLKIEDVETTQTGTGELYAGLFELMKWEMPFKATNVEHISVQSQSSYMDCWFLWMSSGSGDGWSSFYDGSQWLISDTDLDLAICIE